MRKSVTLLFVFALALTVVAAPAGGATGEITKVDQWNTYDDPPQPLAGTTDVAIDRKGRVYVASEGTGAIHVFDGHGAYLRSVPADTPHGVVVDPSNDRLYNIAWGSDKVQVFSLTTGSLITEWTEWDEGGSQMTFDHPLYGAVDKAGNLYVNDGTGEIRKFSPNGTWKNTFGSGIAGVAVSGKRVFAANNAESRVDVFNLAGNLLRSFGSNGTGDGQFVGARGIAVAGSSVYVTDETLPRVQSFDKDGTYRAQATDNGFQRLDNVATDGFGNVYVVDQFSNYVTRFVDFGAAPRCAAKVATILGTLGDDHITGTAGRDVIVALDGRDTVRAGAGNDKVCAGSGFDRVEGNKGRDTIYGQDGRDRLFGHAGIDKLFGQRGPDRLVGGPGVDTMNGGPGTDTCVSEGGETLVNCEL